MPMLADIDDPPRSRVPGLIVGVLVAAPIVAMFATWFIPAFVGTILGGARDLDARLRETDAYMRELCDGAIDLERDEALCGCVIGVEFPSLDCRPHFNEWALELQSDRCADETTHDESLSFCSCVDALRDKMDGAGEDSDARRSAANAYENCEALDDALLLPPAEVLAPPR